jgi:predicted RNA-binding protein with PUA-like domain
VGRAERNTTEIGVSERSRGSKGSHAAGGAPAGGRARAARAGANGPRYWLIKSEPDVFSFGDLWAAPKRTTCWDGVRNYQARNFMRDDMKVGDLVLFYHSNAEPPAVAGVAEVVREAYPDHTAFDAADPHYDPKSRPDAPTWVMVDVRARERFARPVTLAELRAAPRLTGMALLQKGSRLSVQPVRADEWKVVYAMGMKDGR